ncbi:MAG: YceI family protein [Myxococcales bacterium]|nr:YceI family protein [Myxococcales bacterium]
MPTHDATTASCHVLTFKEGMLSAIAHDLRLRVERFRVELDDDGRSITARFEADSLRVECAVKDGRDDPGALRDGQRRDIEANIAKDVLHARRHPTIEFRSTAVHGEGDQRQIEGTLRLHGVERSIHATARREGGRWSAEVSIHQPDFGIKPFSAMLGTLKIQPQVRVRISVPG